MILWCKSCGAYMGVRPPLNDWSIDRENICGVCTEKAKKLEKENESKSEQKDQPNGTTNG